MYGALTKQQTAQTNMEGRIASMDKWISYYSSVADLGLKKLRKGNLTELLMVTLDFVCVSSCNQKEETILMQTQ